MEQYVTDMKTYQEFAVKFIGRGMQGIIRINERAFFGPPFRLHVSCSDFNSEPRIRHFLYGVRQILQCLADAQITSTTHMNEIFQPTWSYLWQMLFHLFDIHWATPSSRQFRAISRHVLGVHFTLEFEMRLVMMALWGEWDRTHAQLLNFPFSFFHFRQPGITCSNHCLLPSIGISRILILLVDNPSGRCQLGACFRQWIEYFKVKTMCEPSGDCGSSTGQVLSLQNIARVCIRRNTQLPLFKSVRKLNLPPPLQWYLLMGDVLDKEYSGNINFKSFLS